VQSVVDQSGVESGLVSVFVPGSTAAVTTMHHEPGGIHDMSDALAQLSPHDAHIQAAIVGPSETFPLRSGQLALGDSQQIVLVDFDDRARERTVVVQVVA
jgi:secondary thiamine-phosphate synthase enzyme